MLKPIFLLLAIMLTFACAESPEVAEDEVQVTPAGPAELVPRQLFFDNPTQAQGRISPNGKWVSWLAPVGNVMNVWVAPSDDPAAAKPVTFEAERGIPVHYWTYDSSHILYTQDQGGNENYHVYAASLDTSSVTDLTPVADGARAVILQLSRDRPDVVAVGLNDRDPQLFDVYEVEIATGARKLVAENPGYAGWELDHQLVPRLAWQQLPGGARNLLSLDEAGERLLAEFSVQDVMTSGIVEFDASNQNVYAIDSRGRDTAALVKINVASGEVELIAADQQADISSVLIDPITREVRAYAAEYTRVKWQGLDDESKTLLNNIETQVDGDLTFVAASSDGNQLVLAADDATQSTSYYVYDRSQNTAKLMFNTRPALAEVSLQPMQALEIPSRDGLTLVSYLTLPEGADTDGDGVPEQPLSTVLYVHGGPWARDGYGYNTTHQWLSDRGYAVLSVNYRGSSGFGKNFLNAAKKEFAGKMHDDLIDAVNWAVERKISDAEQIAIMGGSYGGYATLVGLTFTPDTFACGVDIVGPSNLITLINSFPAYWRPSLEGNWFTFVGDPEKEDEKADMYNRSPIARVADIKSPLLIGQGQNDPRVTKSESDQIVAAMDERNLPVTYLNYPDEGHGFARPENRMSFYATSEAFLSQCLGGRYQPIGDDFSGSSVQVLHGANYVPGLAEHAGMGVDG
jgi:dipeptidyl aminopeptidase/acylaminoacyl peptidase